MRPFTLDRLAEMHRVLRGRAFVRHDIDVSLDCALQMARWESRREIHATYYLMSTSPFYTATEASELAPVLQSLGHQVGFHWDPRQPFPRSYRQLDGTMLVSFHCPDEHLLWRDYAAFDSAYAARWKNSYYADSRGRFTHGDPEDHKGPWPVQVNLHPEWWFDPACIDSIDPQVFAWFFKEPHPLIQEAA